MSSQSSGDKLPDYYSQEWVSDESSIRSVDTNDLIATGLTERDALYITALHNHYLMVVKNNMAIEVAFQVWNEKRPPINGS